MYVRSFQLSDYVQVTNVLEEVLTEACYEDTMEAFGRQLSWDTEMVLLAIDNENGNEKVIGIIIGTIDNHVGYYYRIAVAKKYQRQGVGKALISGMKQRFEKRGVKMIQISVDSHNELVLPVYESAGYTPNHFSRTTHRLSIVHG